MNREDILAASSMPLASPSYPKGPFRFIGREYLLINYETDPDLLRAILLCALCSKLRHIRASRLPRP